MAQLANEPNVLLLTNSHNNCKGGYLLDFLTHTATASSGDQNQISKVFWLLDQILFYVFQEIES